HPRHGSLQGPGPRVLRAEPAQGAPGVGAEPDHLRGDHVAARRRRLQAGDVAVARQKARVLAGNPRMSSQSTAYSRQWRRLLWPLAVACQLSTVGCSDGAGTVHVLFDLHQPSTPISVPTATDDFYALPFPNALRVRDDGTLDLTRFPRVGGQIDEYLAVIDGSPARFQNVGIFFRLDGPLDPSTLPADSNAALDDGAALFAVDLATGQRAPLRTRYTAINYDFIGPDWIAALPEPGFPLHEGHDYAVLITDRLKDAHGKPLRRAADLDAV